MVGHRVAAFLSIVIIKILMGDLATRVLLASSNGLGLRVLFSRWATTSRLDRALLSSLVAASFWMHLTETKHGLSGGSPSLALWSGTFLNLDRALAVASAARFGALWLARQQKKRDRSVGLCVSVLASRELRCAAVSGVCSAVGEWTTSWSLYAALHCCWHAGAYWLIDRSLAPVASAENNGMGGAAASAATCKSIVCRCPRVLVAFWPTYCRRNESWRHYAKGPR